METIFAPASRPVTERRGLVLRRLPPPPPRRRFPWALLAADALLLHLVPAAGPGWPLVLLVEVALFLQAHVAWWERRCDPPVASRIATRTWAFAVALGCLWLNFATTDHARDPSLFRVAFYGFLVWAPIAMIERRWPKDFAPRVIFVCCAVFLAFLVHLDLVADTGFA